MDLTQEKRYSFFNISVAGDIIRTRRIFAGVSTSPDGPDKILQILILRWLILILTLKDTYTDIPRGEHSLSSFDDDPLWRKPLLFSLSNLTEFKY